MPASARHQCLCSKGQYFICARRPDNLFTQVLLSLFLKEEITQQINFWAPFFILQPSSSPLPSLLPTTGTMKKIVWSGLPNSQQLKKVLLDPAVQRSPAAKGSPKLCFNSIWQSQAWGGEEDARMVVLKGEVKIFEDGKREMSTGSGVKIVQHGLLQVWQSKLCCGRQSNGSESCRQDGKSWRNASAVSGKL